MVQSNNTAMLDPNTNTRARCIGGGDDEFVATPGVAARPRPQDRRGGVRVRGGGCLHASAHAMIENSCPGS